MQVRVQVGLVDLLIMRWRVERWGLLGEFRRVSGGRSLFVLFLTVVNFQHGRGKQSGTVEADLGHGQCRDQRNARGCLNEIVVCAT